MGSFPLFVVGVFSGAALLRSRPLLQPKGHNSLRHKVDGDVGQAGLGGVGHLGVVVDGDFAVEDLLEQSLVLLDGEVLHAPGSGGQADRIFGYTQSGALAADLGEGAVLNFCHFRVIFFS